MDAGFRDMFDVHGYRLQLLGKMRPLQVASQGLTFTYDGQDGIMRRTEVVVNRVPTTQHEGTLTWRFHLASKETVTLVIDVIPLIGEDEPMLSYLYDDALQALQASYRRWHEQTTRIRTDNAFLDRGLLRRSQMDLRILLEEFDSGLFPMAGIPWFSAPFGRDALITSIQTLMLNPEIARGTLLYPDGRPVELPAALVEVQGYVYQAKIGLSRILERLGQSALADRLAGEAAELRRRFELKFWLDAEQFYAQGLDRHKSPIPSITSNPAHCLWAGIIDPERAELLRDRLMAPDMFSGWGIRTLSTNSPHYNPMSC